VSHWGGFPHRRTLPFVDLEENETKHGSLWLCPRFDAPQDVTIQEEALRCARCEIIRSEKVSDGSRAGRLELALLLQLGFKLQVQRLI
jgi:hypothetical protein